jgi:cytochrome o ubiquinol oxidase subunit 2
MGKRYRAILAVVLAVGIVLLAVAFLHGKDLVVLNPKGVIASKERHLMVVSTLLMLIVVIPVYFLTFAIAWRYREGNQKAKYTPDWDHNTVLEFIWWGIPSAIIAALAVLTWNSSHALDPFKPLSSGTKPLTVQVVALDWKWLFIYPEQHIATVNYVEFPVNTPINFQITSDAPMNSFWIPQLGGQIYAMSGMASQLNLQADQIGTYQGSSANISGRGFAGMKFDAKAVSLNNFGQWVLLVQQNKNNLNADEYQKLAQPSENNPVAYYSSTEDSLFNKIIMKYMHPGGSISSAHSIQANSEGRP